jgi:hypothetical protein
VDSADGGIAVSVQSVYSTVAVQTVESSGAGMITRPSARTGMMLYRPVGAVPCEAGLAVAAD